MINLSKKLGVALLLSVVLSGCSKKVSESFEYAQVTLDSTSLTLAIADSEAERQQGLSGLDAIPRDGMLFIFEQPDDWGIWMKDMRFALDIIWLRSGQVIDIVENAPPQPGLPENQLTIYKPSQVADMVMEINAGRSRQIDLKIGQTLTLDPKLTK